MSPNRSRLQLPHALLIVAGVAFGVLMMAIGGCFYVQGINQAPVAQIVPESINAPLRGASVTLDAVASDPDGDAVSLQWSAYACAADGNDCDPSPFPGGTSTANYFTFIVPANRDDGVTPTGALRVFLDVTDSYGAVASPRGQYSVAVGDSAPTVALQVRGFTSNNDYPVDAPITFVAQTGDADDGPSNVVLSWQLHPPDGAMPGAYSFAAVANPPQSSDPTVRTEEYLLTPDVVGTWTAAVTATDPVGAMTMMELPVLVQADQPPCLGALTPVVPPDGASFPLDDERRFAVLTVDDDLDVYPPPIDMSIQGTTTFRWFLASPASGGALVELTGVTGNAVDLDPTQYAPGDQLTLRVEIADRIARTLPCDGSAASCSIDGNSCMQRQTWSVGVH